jgi:uncharacterized protein YgiM (DUF1202 family)
MDNAPGVRFVSLTFLVGFGLGAFIGVGLALIAVAIALPEKEEPQVIEVPVFPTATSEPAVTATPSVRATAAVAVRVGPGELFATVGTVSRGDALEVVGRDFDSEWLAIRFPLGSNAQGWIPAAGVQGLDFSTVQALAVLLPTPLPVDVSTPPLFFGTPGTLGTGTPGADDGTPPPAGDTMDLAIFGVTALPDGRVQVLVLNGGPALFTNAILVVEVRTLGSRSERIYFTGDIPAGSTLTVTTSSFAIGDVPENVQVVIDPSSNLKDPNRANNVLTTSLARPVDPVETPATSGPG